MSDFRHGTVNGYQNYGCRCADCSAAESAYQSGKRRERIQRGLPDGDHRHGSANGYGNYGCRCRPCTDAWAARTQARRIARREKARA